MTLTGVDPTTLPAPDRATFVEVNRTTLRVWEWGDPAGPPVICVHGAHDHGRMWDQLAPELAALGYHVRAIDIRGHGESGRLSSGHTWNVSTIDLAALIRTGGRRAGLVGHSMGGGQVLSVASTWPELVSWIVNIDGLGPPQMAFERMPLTDDASRCLANIDRQLGGARRFESLDALVERRAAVNTRLPLPWVEHLVRHGHRRVDDGYVFATDPLFNAGIPDDFSVDHAIAPYPMVSAPTLVLTGTEPDAWSELSASELDRRIDLLQHATHRRIHDAGHYAHIEQPDDVLEAIRHFLTEVESDHRPVAALRSVESAEINATEALEVDQIPRPSLDDPTPRLVVLHDLGPESSGAPWRSAASAWPGRVDAPDLPGHGGARAPVGGHYEAGDVPFWVAPLFPPAAVTRPVVLGVGAAGWSALVFALAGRAEGVVLVDGLGGPWLSIDEATREGIDSRRALLDDPLAIAPHRGGHDPRLVHRPVWNTSRELVIEALDSLSVPALVLESDASTTEPAEAERIAGPRLRRVDGTDPARLLELVASWARADSQLRP